MFTTTRERTRIVISLETSIRLLRLEAALTAGVLAMPIMNAFFGSIGLNQTQIGISQAMFTIALLALNVPTGWLADKISRRMSNALGDLIVAVGFVGYAFAENFAHVIIAEIVVGIGLALTHGVDAALLSAYCEKLKRPFRKEQAFISKWRPIVEMCAMIVGGIVGAHSPRLAIALTAVPFVIGAVLSCFVREEGGRVADHITLVDVVRESLHTNRALRWHIIAYAVAREVTHPLIWILTPLLLLAGVPVYLVGCGWAFNLLMSSIGSSLAGRLSHRLSWAGRFAVPVGIALAVCVLLACHISLWTVWLYGLLGLVRGWVAVTGTDAVVHHSESSQRTTVMSIASSVSQLLYVPTVMLINAAGTHSVKGALIISGVLFAPLALLCGWKLFLLERR